MERADITPRSLAERGIKLVQRRCPGKTLLFVVDEVGQFVARDVQKMLDLQAVVQNLGRIGRGKMWIVVTSQEKLNELVSGLDDKKVELARLMDRFPLQIHLEPADISEVTSKRVLAKNAEAETSLRELFSEHRGRLTDNTRLTADIRLPDLSTESFVDLYPLLPYQVDLIIEVVSGLRTQGGASKHVGGANRTIIKLAQQLLIHPDVDLASKPVGALGADGSDLQPGRGKRRKRNPWQDRRHQGEGRPSSRATRREDHLPAPVRSKHPSYRGEHRGRTASRGRCGFPAPRSESRTRGLGERRIWSVTGTMAIGFRRRQRTTGRDSARAFRQSPGTSAACTPRL